MWTAGADDSCATRTIERGPLVVVLLDPGGVRSERAAWATSCHAHLNRGETENQFTRSFRGMPTDWKEAVLFVGLSRQSDPHVGKITFSRHFFARDQLGRQETSLGS
jgi:hypothetical protein